MHTFIITKGAFSISMNSYGFTCLGMTMIRFEIQYKAIQSISKILKYNFLYFGFVKLLCLCEHQAILIVIITT